MAQALLTCTKLGFNGVNKLCELHWVVCNAELLLYLH